MFENLKVEWVPGAAPTAHFLDAEGQTINQVEVGDKSYDELISIFQEHKFTPKKKEITYSDQPNDVYEFGGHRYELYNTPNFFDKAVEFAKSKVHKGETGYIVSIESPEENEVVHLLLKRNNAKAAWLGAQDVEEEGKWKWTQGPNEGRLFWDGLSKDGKAFDLYVNWREGEPNDAENEDCASILGEDGKWNDARCESTNVLLIEYGSKPSVVPKTEL